MSRKVIVGVNDFASKHPELLKEWDYEENDKLGIFPNKVSFGSQKKVWWKCSVCGYKWQAVIGSRSSGKGCFECAHRKIGHINSLPKAGNTLQDKFPELLKEWDYKKNNELGIYPNKVSSCSSCKKVWWKCSKGHSWQARISNRTVLNRGCPFCSGREVILGHNDLATVNPALAKEWNYEKNGDLLPTQVAYCSNHKVWWRCDKGHEWQALINSRSRGNGCPVCGNKKIILGYNDLVTFYPKLEKEWNYEKNGNLLPTQVSIASNRRVWWKCCKGHEWRTAISHRTLRNSGCPKCYADKQTSFAEQAIYYFLNMFFSDEVKNRCKLKDKDGYIEADIFLSKQKVVVEHDGIYWHRNKHNKDLKKECRFKAMGNKFIRIAEYNDNKIVKNCIFYNCRKNFDENLTWAIKELFSLLGISSLFVDVVAFRDKILEFSHTNEIKNSLAVVNPQLAKEWNYEKNGSLKPEYFTPNSKEKVWWKCSNGHEWQAVISSRHSRNTVCPVCSGRKLLTGFNDLAFLYPNIAKEWNYEKNNNLLPSEVLYKSSNKVWWKCQKCGHEWQTTVYCRTVGGTGCPICSKVAGAKKHSVPKEGQSLQDKFPNIAKDWDFLKNGELTPDKVSFGSQKRVFWKCFECGYEWITTVTNRTSGYRVCPVCNKEKHKRSK